ncbi:2-succinyl-5-enolpyruvyl-6-hydroxy-3-cyclohexene-1-carboxylate synthase [Fodinibius roseus]|uniref:2-succinyl-5-enolpyruvyl-6-hydroxy-3-cyclohexene-1-carboxylate synthase n=1 Tax=Fodinibius roseus TaxID=1194090 RepID=A0A1M4T549_9BACT|nr:2-succinyl-5-enolpyruvyl-6-hydroxy-3-cyclohexene-1-carboxylic-acid synthase [Fodinibius roseus]SHE39521.1 2-succinyl-5-enolpyruvyl-6-hydroxy-3-cyclohexene-1-carboxylate synthase [Fodinibius roseus]
MKTDIAVQNIPFYWATIFFRRLLKAGVRHVIISPGSRSTPLTMAAAAQSRLRKQVILDERSAAFTALGVGKATGHPAVLVCTSGTATANYFPAVIEARQSGVPMILATADRPPHLRSTGANQAIDQLKLFGGYPVFFHEVGEPGLGDDDLKRLAMLSRQAVGLSQQKRGPVHLNFPFRKPLEPEPGFVKKISDENSDKPLSGNSEWRQDGSFHLSDKIQQAMRSARRPLIVVGPTAPGDDTGSIAGLAKKLNAPVLTESTMPDQQHVSHGFAIFLRNKHVREQLQPDLLLRFGFQPTAKSLEKALGDWQPGHHLHFASTSDWQDATFSESEHLPWGGRPLSLGGLPDSGGDSWLKKWKRQELLAEEHLQVAMNGPEALTDGHIYHHLLPQCPDDHFVAVSNSFPARDVQLFGGRVTRHPLLLNRGASGIDGVTSTAMGISLGIDRPGVLVTGDLAFLHDANALLNRETVTQDLTVIVINNVGGSIFRMLPIEQHDTYFENYFETPQSADVQRLAASFHIPCHRIQTLEQIRQFDLKQWQKQHRGLSVIECRTNADASMELRKTCWSYSP